MERVAVAALPTEWGDFQIAGYRSLVSDEEFVALFKGEMRTRHANARAHPFAVFDW